MVIALVMVDVRNEKRIIPMSIHRTLKTRPAILCGVLSPYLVKKHYELSSLSIRPSDGEEGKG